MKYKRVSGLLYKSTLRRLFIFIIYLNIFNQDNLISNAVFHQGPEKHNKMT